MWQCYIYINITNYGIPYPGTKIPIHKFFIRTYQKAPIVQHYTYNTIKTNNYIHISCTHIDKGERYITSTPIADIIDSINICNYVSLINTTMPFLSAISHKDVLSRIAHSYTR